jgi:FkbM family methyltransferase
MTSPDTAADTPAARSGRSPATIAWDINFRGQTRRFTLFDTPLGKAVCRLVFDGKCYPPVKFSGDVKTIVDVGANVGASAVYFSIHHPKARLLAFEPTAAAYALLASNTSDLQQVKTFPFGLFDRDRQATLHHGSHDSVQNSIGQSDQQTQGTETIQLRETAAVFRELKLDTIDILKLDTEGCEVPILLSMYRWIPKTGVIYVEFHSESDRLEIDRLLTPTHFLCKGEISRLCRGELCYIAKNRLPPGHDRQMGISLG